jgi:hypothetical protein
VGKNFFSSFPGTYSSARVRASETYRAIIIRPAGAGLVVSEGLIDIVPLLLQQISDLGFPHLSNE